MSRYRLYPTSEQEAVLLSHCAHARFVWNLAVDQGLNWHQGRGPAPKFAEQCHQLAEARTEFEWLRAGSSTVQQQALRDYRQAMSNFFAGTHGRPTFRKAGWITFRWSRQVPEAKSYRVTRDRAGRWHLAFAAAPDAIPAPGNGASIGVDRGVAVSAALSNGEMERAPGLRPMEAERLRRLKRKLSRAKPGSKRRAKVKAQIARIEARAADRRKDWAEKLSTRLARDYDLIALEHLNVRAMTASAKGTVEQPGRNVRQKAGLNKGILASGRGLLERRLNDKAPGRVVKVNAAYTSLRCNACWSVNVKNRESQAFFSCVACGHTANADFNAACNIRDIAKGRTGSEATAARHAVAARGEGSSESPMNREPLIVLAA